MTCISHSRLPTSEEFDTEEIKRSTVDVDNRRYLQSFLTTRRETKDPLLPCSWLRKGEEPCSNDPTHAALGPLGHEDAMMEGLQNIVSFRLPCRCGGGYNREGSAIRKERNDERREKG
jgi:hypothetical protein